MIRTILTILFVVVFLIISLILELVVLVLRKIDSKKADLFSRKWVSFGLLVVRGIAGTKLTVRGAENIPDDRAVVFMGNHRSFFDVILTYPLVKRPTGYLAKIEMKKVPLLSTWMRNIHCLFLDRKDIKQGLETILEAADLVKNGISVFVFPEGTRSRAEGEFGEFRGGSFKIAEKAGAPVIPVTIVGTGAILEDHFPWIYRKPAIIEFGKPIETKGLKPAERKKIPEMTRNIIMETYEKNKALL